MKIFKLFKTLKRKAGNVLMPVIGTIAALTILAGSCVAFALNSSRIVYRNRKVDNSNESRNILYIATRYFSQELNEGTEPSVAKEELKNTFDFLEITKDHSDDHKFYLFYPLDEKARSEAGSNAAYKSSGGTWLMSTVKQTSDQGAKKDIGMENEISKTLFSEDAKLDQLYNIGNLATVYLTDEKLLPGRTYDLDKISLVEADIDTFDEAFTYMNNSGVIEIDSILVALYGYVDKFNHQIVRTPTIDSDNNTKTAYSIVYETGNLGGNYYWQNTESTGMVSHTNWIYRQEYDMELLREMMDYIFWRDNNKTLYRFFYKQRDSVGNGAPNKYSDYDMTYEYIDSSDTHIITGIGYVEGTSVKATSISKVYHSTLDFARDMSDFIFWKNLPRLALQMEDFVTAFQEDLCASSEFKSHSSGGGVSSVAKFEYTWNNDGTLNINTYWKSNPSNYWYFTRTITDIQRVLNSLGYDTNEKIYTALTEKTVEKIIADKVIEEIGTVTSSMIRDKVTNVHNKWDITNQVTIRYNNKNLNYTSKYSTDKMAAAIADYVGKTIYDKYITGHAKIGQSIWSSGDTVADMNEDTSKLFADFQFQMDYRYINGRYQDCVKISFHFFVVLARNNGELRNYYSDETGDTIYLTVDQFVQTFPTQLAWCLGKTNIVPGETEIEKLQIATKEQLKKDMVTPIGYQYQPISSLNEIIGKGDTHIFGLKEETIYTNLLMFYFDKEKDRFKSQLADKNYNIKIKSFDYYDELENPQYLMLDLTYEIELENGTKLSDRVTFYLDYMTYAYHNNEIYNSELETYYRNPNVNYYSQTDADGKDKSFFTAVSIKDETGNKILDPEKLSTNIPAIVSCIPYKERERLVKYGYEKVNISGTEYTLTNSLSDLANVNKNYLYDGTIENLGSSTAQIHIKEGQSLFINGDLFLKENQDLIIDKGGMIYINGNFVIYYEYNGYGSDGRSIPSSASTRNTLTKDDISWYKTRGVNITAPQDGKIFVNGNLDYRGYKARYSTNNGTIQSSTGYSSSQLDGVMFQQNVFAANTNCAKNKDNDWVHNPNECRSDMSGIFIVNGDVKFRAWDELNTSNAANPSKVEKYYIYRNCYSNPNINATFYVDGTFDMRGLYTSSLYEPCRANFVFAKSIIQPAIALNTVLARGNNKSDQYGDWANTDGFLFMIVEEAIDFSKVNFACVNLFTPFEQLLAAINENKEADTNFSEFITLGTWTTMYPKPEVIQYWGLPSLLKQGFDKMYAPIGGVGSFRDVDDIMGDDDW